MDDYGHIFVLERPLIYSAKEIGGFCRNSDRRGYRFYKGLQVIYFGILFKKKNKKFEFRIRYKVLEGTLGLLSSPLDSPLDPEK